VETRKGDGDRVVVEFLAGVDLVPARHATGVKMPDPVARYRESSESHLPP